MFTTCTLCLCLCGCSAGDRQKSGWESVMKGQESGVGCAKKQKKKQNPTKTMAYDTEEGAHVTPCKEAGWTHIIQESKKRTKWRREKHSRQRREMAKKYVTVVGSPKTHLGIIFLTFHLPGLC